MVGSTLAAEAPGSVLLITTDGDAADDAVVDFRFFLEAATVEQFPQWESLPTPEVPPNKEILAERFELLSLLANPAQPNPKIIVAPIRAIQQPVVKPEVIEESYRTIKLDQDLPPAELADWLIERAFARLPQVDAPGEFSIRGGIMDIYPIGGAWPIRIEYFGDTIDSIRRFDPGNQRSTQKLTEFKMLAVDETKLHHLKPKESGLLLMDYLPGDTWVFIREPAAVQEKAQSAGQSEFLKQELYSYGTLQKAWRNRPTLYLSEMPQSRGDNHADFRVRSTERFAGEIDTVAAELMAAAVPNDKLYISCHNTGEKDRLQELLEGSPLAGDPKLEYLIGDLTSGFEIDDFRMVFITHHELFHHYTGPMRPARVRHASSPVEDWLELEAGDLVVHLVHGIARYHGMEAFERNGEMGEFLVLEFAGGSRVYVPTTHVELVQKYLGPAKTKPNLSKIGGKRWAKKKEDVQEAVEDLAVELLRLQAARESMPGHEYPPDDKWQMEFEAAFPFEATEDQVTATASIKADMQKARPMDRLLCGDVGYGKTEVAMRTAFKTVMSNKQVAVLVPTTVLAEQHYHTFTERMGTFPVRIEVISRFRNKKEQKEILEAAANGSVDILIGTHRIVQKDVNFRDLGLIVVDEEQRFGVEHKEFLKWMRQTVNVLTMTATPIPRTLHMSLVGIRDISALNTPPQDRQSIRSEVVRFDERLIRDSIEREMNRGGQVFFLHNRVHNITEMAARLSEIVPEARIVVGHGQMAEGELESAMRDFINKVYDILVCTTIIGSGVDIPNVNTIFVNDADRFGLAELHQLRGRVGRYKHRAYAYFLIPEERPITQKGLRRLKAIEEFAELGSGFKIAMRDLEIRGAGNIIGPEQSGHIGAVGYELYCKLLEMTVLQLKDEPMVVTVDVRVELGFTAYLPNDYVQTDKQKMEVYRRISRSYTINDLNDLKETLVDRFGKIPKPVQMMLTQAEIRILAQPWEFTHIRVLGDRVEFRAPNASKAAKDIQLGRQYVRELDRKTVHVMFPHDVKGEDDICAFIKEILATKKAPDLKGVSVVPAALLDSMRPRK